MLILPAIDILDGQCVRLHKGEYGTASKVAEDAVATARSFASAGAEMIHTVDLNGAKSGVPENMELICRIASSVSIPVEIGGGIRNMDTVDRYIDGGIARVILGTSALQNPEFVRKAVKKYGDKIAVGIDAKGGMVCVDGWTNSSSVKYTDFARLMEDIGVDNIIFTDIDKDGTLTEPNFEQLGILSETVGVKITASGGIKDISHIEKLTEMGLYAAICGKSLYSGTLDLKEAIAKGAGK